MITATPGGTYVISAGGAWRPGSFETAAAALLAQRLDDETLARLQSDAAPEPVSEDAVRRALNTGRP